MKQEEIGQWLGGLFPSASFSLIDARLVALDTLDGLPVAVTVGFSTVDTGLVMLDDPETSVRCEIVCRAAAEPIEVGSAVVAATRMIERTKAQAKPCTVLENLLPERQVRHGLLREPELFERGTPLYNEPGQMTLLVELILLSDDELEVYSERGYAGLETRLRRRGVRVEDWAREAL